MTDKSEVIAYEFFLPYRKLLHEPYYFLRWWYWDMGRKFALGCLYMLARTEDTFSFLVMLKQLVRLQPLHQDYALIGRAIGVVIRLIWICIGLAAISALALICMLFLLLWLAIPLLPWLGILWSLT